MNYATGNETRGYNVLGQLTNVTVQLPYSPYSVAENLTYTYPPNGTNNGKISSMYNAVSGETVTYAYDSLNRLLTANSNANWGQQYGFDGFGNLLSKTVTAGSGPSLSQVVNPANNQISGLYGGYDANGNTADAYANGQFYALSYDAENRVSSMGYSGGLTVASYAYDSQNRRIWSWPGFLDSWGNVNGYTVNVYTPGGQKLAAYTLGPSVYNNQPFLQVGLTTSDQYFGGRRLATMDQLGSVGNYFPWGEDKGGTSPQNTWNFATYWRDSVSGLDYANNRYYNNAYGSFMTPDQYQGTSGGPGDTNNPQSWNHYAYALGDPANRNDPTGRDSCSAASSYASYVYGGDPEADFTDGFAGADTGSGCYQGVPNQADVGWGTCVGGDGSTPNPSPYCQIASVPAPAPSAPPVSSGGGGLPFQGGTPQTCDTGQITVNGACVSITAPPPPSRPRPIHTRKENVCWYLTWFDEYVAIVTVFSGPAAPAIGTVFAFGGLAYVLFCQ
jgi:RHS repeat-associated protein